MRLVQVIGLETEIRFVLRDVLERGLPLDDVEIAYTAATPYQGLLFDAVERWDLPADFAAGVPTSLTRPGRWLAAFLGWVADDLDVAVLAKHLRAGEFFWTEKSVSPGAVVRWLLQGHAGAGREQTLAALDRLTPAGGRMMTSARGWRQAGRSWKLCSTACPTAMRWMPSCTVRCAFYGGRG